MYIVVIVVVCSAVLVLGFRRVHGGVYSCPVLLFICISVQMNSKVGDRANLVHGGYILSIYPRTTRIGI